MSPEIYLGTWQVSPSDGFWTGQDVAESEKVISFAVRSGIRGFDTAAGYSRGRAEQVLSKVLRRFPGIPFRVDTKIMPAARDLSDIVRENLGRLRPLKIDCLYLHWPSASIDNFAMLRGMDALRTDGLVGKIGVCNISVEALSLLVSRGLCIDRYQMPMSLLWTRGLSEAKEFCHRNSISLVAYSPTGMGLLSGRYRRPEDLDDRRAELFCFREPCRKAYLELLDLVTETAENNGVSNTSVAFSWTRSRNPDIILLGARNTRQLQENLENDLELSETELADLTEAASGLEKASRGICTNIFSYEVKGWT